MEDILFSAPTERYETHIDRCLNKFEIVFPRFASTISRILEFGNIKILYSSLKNMITSHDLGKLTDKWQYAVQNNQKTPAHAPVGAAYLFKKLPEKLREPIAFAVTIHHTDRGLLGDNIEKPDVQAILDGIVDNTGKIHWSKYVNVLPEDYFNPAIEELTVYDLKDMARGLRIWAKGCSVLEQHHRRLQAMLVHHLLKLSDISAAVERKFLQEEKEKYEKEGKNYFGGWLMVEKISEYVNSISGDL